MSGTSPLGLMLGIDALVVGVEDDPKQDLDRIADS